MTQRTLARRYQGCKTQEISLFIASPPETSRRMHLTTITSYCVFLEGHAYVRPEALLGNMQALVCPQKSVHPYLRANTRYEREELAGLLF